MLVKPYALRRARSPTGSGTAPSKGHATRRRTLDIKRSKRIQYQAVPGPVAQAAQRRRVCVESTNFTGWVALDFFENNFFLKVVLSRKLHKVVECNFLFSKKSNGGVNQKTQRRSGA